MTATGQVTDLPAMSIDFKAQSFVVDPYPVLEQIRAAGPIVHHPELDFYMVSGYRECARVMGLARLFASDVEHFVELFGGATMECMDNPRHDQVKSIWAKDFQRGTLAQQSDMIASVVDEQMDPIIEQLKSGERVDAVTAFTRTIPTIVIARLMGIDRNDFPSFAQWSDDMGGVLEARDDGSEEGRALTARAKKATIELNDYIAHEIQVRRQRGTGDDLVSKMANSSVPMADDEVVASNTQLVFAGNETTSKLMGYTLLALAQHPDQRDQLRQDRSLILQAIEEVHRWTSVLVYNLRFVKEDDTLVAGVPLPAGTTVMALQAAANRDPERWDDPADSTSIGLRKHTSASAPDCTAASDSTWPASKRRSWSTSCSTRFRTGASPTWSGAPTPWCAAPRTSLDDRGPLMSPCRTPTRRRPHLLATPKGTRWTSQSTRTSASPAEGASSRAPRCSIRTTTASSSCSTPIQTSGFARGPRGHRRLPGRRSSRSAEPCSYAYQRVDARAFVGASVAGLATATASRRRGHTGTITLLSDEVHVPYDRPPLSKHYLADEWALDRLDLVPAGSSPTSTSTSAPASAPCHSMSSPGECVPPTARHTSTTRSSSRPGSGRGCSQGFADQAIHVLRTLDDANRLRQELKPGTRLLVVGAGFVGLETAATARKLGASVTVMEPLEHPLASRLGSFAAERLLELHRSRGVDVLVGTSATTLVEHGATKHVVISTGERLKADVVLVAVGSVPCTEWLEASGVTVDNGVVCDEFSRAAQNVWAAGDVARWHHVSYGRSMRVEHRTNATEQGQHVAAGISGDLEPYTPVPFFWSDHFGVKVQLAGVVTPDAVETHVNVAGRDGSSFASSMKASDWSGPSDGTPSESSTNTAESSLRPTKRPPRRRARPRKGSPHEGGVLPGLRSAHRRVDRRRDLHRDARAHPRCPWLRHPARPRPCLRRRNRCRLARPQATGFRG